MKTCKQCGASFEETKNTQQYCSVGCKNKFWGNNYYIKNRIEILKNIKTEDFKEKQKKYTKSPERKKWLCGYLKTKRKTNFKWKLKECICDRIRMGDPTNKKLQLNLKKNIEIYLGYTIDDLCYYLTNSNEDIKQQYLNNDIELDHIIPYNKFIILDLGDDEFKKCWSLKNLRFLSKTENRQRHKCRFSWVDEVMKYNLIDILPAGPKDLWEKMKSQFDRDII